MKNLKVLGTPLKFSISFYVGFVYFTIAIGWNQTWLFGLAFTSLIFGIILLHEFGHFFTAKLFGIKPKTIEMNVIGGAVTFEDTFEDEKSYKKFLTTLGGPMVNLVIMFILGFNIDLETDKFELLNLAKIINISLLVFNILPLYPLDGGKLLQYTFEMINGNFHKSKLIALITGFTTGLIVIVLCYRYEFWIILFFTVVLVYFNFNELKKYKDGKVGSV